MDGWGWVDGQLGGWGCPVLSAKEWRNGVVVGQRMIWPKTVRVKLVIAKGVRLAGLKREAVRRGYFKGWRFD